MLTLVLNCGSSSLKFQLINLEHDQLVAKGMVEKIGTGRAILSYWPANRNPIREIVEIYNHEVALKLALNVLTDAARGGVLDDISQIDAVGHRVAHGGEKFSASVLVTDEVKKEIDYCSIFAPLHNPANLMGINACSELLGIDQVAVFDTAFHQQIPQRAYLYPLPFSIYERFKIRKYGFHGTSHAYVGKQAAKQLGKNFNDLKLISCHLGNGASIAAIKDGISVDTTMGFTPLDGLMMGTRCGNIDPAIVTYLIQNTELDAAEVNRLMNSSSGLKGISQTSNDMREVEEEAKSGSKSHQLALDMYCYRIKQFIGNYYAILNGIDALIFTAGVGENSATIRSMVCEDMEALGIEIDPKKNEACDPFIGTGKVNVMIVPTNEELAIAQETYRIIHAKLEETKVRKEQEKMEMELAKISEADKAKIAIVWSKHQDRSDQDLLDIIEKENGLKVDQNVFEKLLKVMDLRNTDTIGTERTQGIGQ